MSSVSDRPKETEGSQHDEKWFSLLTAILILASAMTLLAFAENADAS